MKIYITGLPSGYEVEHLVRLFYPMAPLTLTPPDAGEDCVWAEKKPEGLWAMVRQGGKCAERSAPLPAPAEAGGETPEFSLASLTYDLLRQWTGIRPPWGMMTGVRPVRIIHDLRAEGKTEEEIEQRFLQHFDCTPRRFAMAKSIADLQRPVLERAQPMDCSVYAGIPFCPSRCSYCSFVSRTVGDKSSRALVAPYVDCLCKELAATRAAADAAHLSIKTLYIGGGTPTSVNAQQLRQLMGTMAEQFDLPALEEFTVEAGRPDCTDEEKLRIIKESGATRISINPQTMADKVLEAVGRRHTARQTVEAYEQAVKAGFDDINMDLIAGLPADDAAGFADSIRQVLDLNPSNITVHTLALKKGAALFGSRMELPSQEAVAAMLAGAEDALRQNGYEPYYLYRQKYMSGSFENTGWCRPGYTGLYNIYMMEELHTILSLGGGGMNKINLPEEKLARYHNPKIPQDYISRIDTILQQKDEIFSILREIREQNP